MKQVMVKRFTQITSKELIEVLGLTIKHDQENKLITFLCFLSAYTEESQFNISFNAPSSTGKSYIPLEIVSLFPTEDVIEVCYCSPTAFFHDYGEMNAAKDGYSINLERRIIIFLDQPHSQLLAHLRPLLSHDKKQLSLKITDKSEKGGLRTKNITMKGFPAVVFCSAGLRIDEQESTRFILLSPEMSQEKIREAIQEKIDKEADKATYTNILENKPKRQSLKQRIRAIKGEHITDIIIANPKLIEEEFLRRHKTLKPRHMRDVGRVTSLVKVLALLNLWGREKDGAKIIANEEDIREAFRIWDVVYRSQELNLPPYVSNIYTDVILSLYKEKNDGITRQEIMKKHFEVYGRILEDWRLRQQIIPPLETAGLIIQQPDEDDKRNMLVYAQGIL